MRAAPTSQPPALHIDNLFAVGPLGADALCGLSLSVRPGEIYGLAGVAGNGQSELCDVLCGLLPARAGELRFFGTVVTRHSVAARRQLGLACIPEDRYAQGCAASLPLLENVLLTHLDAPELASAWPGFLSRSAIFGFVSRVLAPLELSPAIIENNPPAGSLSGGTLQKLILARELAHKPRLLLAAYPCRGLDIGATRTVHALLKQARQQGCAILLLSEQLDELLALCDRVGALVHGRLAGQVALSPPWQQADAPLCDRPQAHLRLGNLISGLPADGARS